MQSVRYPQDMGTQFRTNDQITPWTASDNDDVVLMLSDSDDDELVSPNTTPSTSFTKIKAENVPSTSQMLDDGHHSRGASPPTPEFIEMSDGSEDNDCIDLTEDVGTAFLSLARENTIPSTAYNDMDTHVSTVEDISFTVDMSDEDDDVVCLERTQSSPNPRSKKRARPPALHGSKSLPHFKQESKPLARVATTSYDPRNKKRARTAHAHEPDDDVIILGSQEVWVLDSDSGEFKPMQVDVKPMIKEDFETFDVKPKIEHPAQTQTQAHVHDVKPTVPDHINPYVQQDIKPCTHDIKPVVHNATVAAAAPAAHFHPTDDDNDLEELFSPYSRLESPEASPELLARTLAEMKPTLTLKRYQKQFLNFGYRCETELGTGVLLVRAHSLTV